MARTFTPRVGRRVTYFNAAGKPQAAKIVTVGSSNGGVTLRPINNTVVKGDATTGILRGSVADTGARTNVWTPR